MDMLTGDVPNDKEQVLEALREQAEQQEPTRRAKGAKARAANQTPTRRSEVARRAAAARYASNT